jgi:hypothetical protein
MDAILASMKVGTNASKLRGALWNSQKDCVSHFNGKACTLDVAAAVPAGLGYASSMLKIAGGTLPAQETAILAKRLGLFGATVSLVNVVGQTFAAHTLSDSQSGIPSPSLLQDYNAVLGAVSGYASFAEALGGATVLAGLALPLSIGSGVVALTYFVYDDWAKRLQQQDDELTEALAIQRYLSQVARARGKADLQSGKAQTGVKLCGFGASGLCLVQVTDPQGNYSLAVPIDVAGTDYSQLSLDTFDPVSGASYGSRVVDLRGLNPDTPIQIPAPPRNCIGEYDQCTAGCTVG